MAFVSTVQLKTVVWWQISESQLTRGLFKMVTSLHDTGEEFIMDAVFRADTITDPNSVTIGLFFDSTDALSDSSDIGAITTEPTGAAYAAQTATMDTTDFTNEDSGGGDWQTTITDQTFDTSDSTQDVDAYYISLTFAAEDTNDAGTATEHLFWTGDLDQTYDLNSVDSLTLSGAGLRVN